MEVIYENGSVKIEKFNTFFCEAHDIDSNSGIIKMPDATVIRIRLTDSETGITLYSTVDQSKYDEEIAGVIKALLKSHARRIQKQPA